MSTYFGGNIPWVKSGELGDGHVFDSEETLSELGLKSSNAKLFPKGTLCIALYGATVGKLGILEVDAATNQAVCGLFLPDDVHRDFVFYYLASIRHRLIEQGKGGAQSNISNGLVRQIRIPIAPLNEQVRIVAKIEELFSDLDAGVAALKRAKANLKRYRASVLKSAVEGKLTEQWRAKHPAKEPASALLARILLERRQKWEADQRAKFAAAKKEPPKNWRDKYVEPTPPDTTGLPELPEGWCWASLDSLLKEPLRNGHSARASRDGTGVRTLTLTAVTYGDFSENNIKYTTADPADVEDLWIEPGDILIERSNTPELVGTARLFTGPSRFAIFPDLLIRIRVSPSVDMSYCGLFLESHLARRYFQTNAKGLAGSMPKIDQATITRCAVPLPPLNEQMQIRTEVAERLSQIDAAEAQIEHGLLRAARLRQSILKRAFEGKLVPQDPKDEPASALLERLRASRTIHEGSGNRPTSSIPHRSKSRGKKS
jgi:type I restriction enzyme S subunit